MIFFSEMFICAGLGEETCGCLMGAGGKMGHGQKIEVAARCVCGRPSLQRPLVRSTTWVALGLGAKPQLGLFSECWPRASPAHTSAHLRHPGLSLAEGLG